MEIVVVALLCYIAFREVSFRREEDASRRERGDLLQRIQAPELAVVSHASDEPREPVNGMPLFSDEDYAEMTNGN